MSSTIQIKRGTGSAVPSGLADGELAINLDNGQLYFGSGSTSVNNFKFTNLTAENYIVSSSVTNITTQQLSGSTDFGDDSADIHKRTGSLNVSGALSIDGTTTGNNGVFSGDLDVAGEIECDHLNIADVDDGIHFGDTQVLFVDGDNNVNFGVDGNAAVDLELYGHNHTYTAGGGITLDAGGDILLDAAGDDINFADNGTTRIRMNTANGTLKTDSHITASGNISGSESTTLTIGGNATIGGAANVTDLIASRFIVAAAYVSASNFISETDLLVKTNITASGDITASGTIIGDVGQFSQIKIDGEVALHTGDSATTGRVFLDSQITKIQIGKAGAATQTVIEGNITASGNISSSGTVSASIGAFGTLSPILKLGGVESLTNMGSNQLGIGEGGTYTTIYLGRGNQAVGSFEVRTNANINTLSSITSSGNISSSGNIIGTDITVVDDLFIKDDIFRVGDTDEIIKLSDTFKVEIGDVAETGNSTILTVDNPNAKISMSQPLDVTY